MATGHFPLLTLRENRASAGKPRAFRRLIPFELTVFWNQMRMHPSI